MDFHNPAAWFYRRLRYYTGTIRPPEASPNRIGREPVSASGYSPEWTFLWVKFKIPKAWYNYPNSIKDLWRRRTSPFMGLVFSFSYAMLFFPGGNYGI
jgi:hypothetical protein